MRKIVIAIITVFILTGFFVRFSFADFIPGSNAVPMSAYDTRILSAFKYVMFVPNIAGISSPTVVQVPISDSAANKQIAVYEEQTGKFLYAQLNEKTPIVGPVIMLNGTGPDILSLHDGNTATAYDIPSNGQPTMTTFTYSTPYPTTVNELQITSSQYSSAPTSVTVYYYDQTTGEKKLAVYSQSLTNGILFFPDTYSNKWVIILSHVQPLRISEMALTDINAPKIQSVLFTANPGMSYEIYTDSDYYASIPEDEPYTDLSSVPNPLLIKGGAVQGNPLYRQNNNGNTGLGVRNNTCPGQNNAFYPSCYPQEDKLVKKYPWLPVAGIVVGFGATFLIFAVTVKGKKESEDQNSK